MRQTDKLYRLHIKFTQQQETTLVLCCLTLVLIVHSTQMSVHCSIRRVNSEPSQLSLVGAYSVWQQNHNVVGN